ncbi:hypothetical protein H8D30_03835 [bacterium]|nr:hypothetical protein [bacterium]
MALLEKTTAKRVGMRVSPQKMGRVALIVRNLPLFDAISALEARKDRASDLLLVLIKEAAHNAEHNLEIPSGGLVVSRVEVGSAARWRRFRPQPRGNAHPYRRATAFVSVTLGEM